MRVPGRIDLLKLHKADYAAPAKPVLLDIGFARYLAIEGEGQPGGQPFQARVAALYAMAYTIKMSMKFAGLADFGVSKLECRYLNLNAEPLPPRSQWCWQLLIRVPECVTGAELADALALLQKRGKEGDSALVFILELHEGPSIQLLHVGPYEEEHRSVERMQSFAAQKGLRLSGLHHEIFISDPRRVEPARLKTILRLPLVQA